MITITGIGRINIDGEPEEIQKFFDVLKENKIDIHIEAVDPGEYDYKLFRGKLSPYADNGGKASVVGEIEKIIQSAGGRGVAGVQAARGSGCI